MSSEPLARALPNLPAHPRVYRSVLDLIHDTPLLELALDQSQPRATV
jgi:hypothetical protein